MSKTRYLVAKKQAKELYDLVPYITPRIAFRYIQQLDLPKEETPVSHTIIFEWFKDGEYIQQNSYSKELSLLFTFFGLYLK